MCGTAFYSTVFLQSESGGGLSLPAKVFLCLPQLTANTLTQETIERIPEIFNSEAPTLSPYLTSSSTSTNEMMSKTDNKT